MIDLDEINAKADEFGLHTSNVQRDYVFGWLIGGLFEVSALRDVVALKGGTSDTTCPRTAGRSPTRSSHRPARLRGDHVSARDSAMRPNSLRRSWSAICTAVPGQNPDQEVRDFSRRQTDA
jgi:hypothetical protein